MSLQELVGDTDRFLAEHWTKKPAYFPGGYVPAPPITSSELLELIDCSALTRPYFVTFKESTRPPWREITESRAVGAVRGDGYLRTEGVRKELREGATFKLNQPEQWHPRIASYVDGLRPHFNAALEAFVFYSPGEVRGMKAHTDGRHVIALQLEGRKRWCVYEPRAAVSVADLADTDGLSCSEFVLDPGDVLYVPHGWPHQAIAADGASLHLAVTIEEPNARDIADCYAARIMAGLPGTELLAAPHLLPPEEKAERVLAFITKTLRELPAEDIEAMAIDIKRGRRESAREVA
jgi:ribosomal protein L16 Arg81 hydroxylase